MKLKPFLTILCLSALLWSSDRAVAALPDRAERPWKARWISSGTTPEQPNTWLNYRYTADLPALPSSVVARIGADSKYWLWVNGRLVVFEGGLKRGPNPQDTYYDEVELAPYLVKGKNTIAVLLWYFGKPSFSHNDSGKAGLIFDCQTADFDILSDETWKCETNAAYGTCDKPDPNFRLAESNIRYDGRKSDDAWYMPSFDDRDMTRAVDNGPAGCRPWNKLVKRPIPLWKIGELRDYASQRRSGDSIICTLPYNAQITPYIKLKAHAGDTVKIMSDNYLVYNGGDNYLRCEYIAREGLQSYENLGWTNGHKIYYVLPKGAEAVELKFRETGYDTEFTGEFECSDPLYNRFWKKALRTLYLTMRDTYMDCPDRERAQWWGDAVNELGEAFYALSPSSHKLAAKGIRELVNWQRDNGVLYSPVPGVGTSELPLQMLASIGWYGFYTQYFYSGDSSFVAEVYEPVHRYLHQVWQVERNTLPVQ